MIGLAALAVGTYVLVDPDLMSSLAPGLKTGFGLAIILYGAFRI